MKCQDSRQVLYTYLDGELSSYEESALYGHLAACQSCQLDMDQARNLHNLLDKTIKHVEPPPGFAKKVMANLDKYQLSAAEDHVLDLGSSRSIAKETDQKTAAQRTAGGFKMALLKSRWVGIAAGIVFAFMSYVGFNQVAQIAFDPKAENGIYFGIVPKDYHELLAENNVKQTGDAEGQPDVSKDNIPGSENSFDVENPVSDNTNQRMADGRSDTLKEDSRSGGGQGQQPNSGSEGSSGKQAGQENQHAAPGPNPEQDSLPFITSEPIIAANPTSTITLNMFGLQVNSAAWSPNGQQLRYMIEDNGKFELFESQTDGQGQKSLGTYNAVGIWSPDKEKLLYSKVVDGKSTLWLEHKGEAINLTPYEEGAKGDGAKWAYNPIWSSKNEIAYLTGRYGGTEIMVVDLQGNSRRITNSSDAKSNLAWSPDGSEIAYYKSWEDKGALKGEIAVVSLNGEKPRSVTPTIKAGNMVPTWSPDGKLLAVNVNGEEQGIWLARSDGSDWEKRLTGKGGGKVLSWSPDGQKIAFNDAQGAFHILIWRSASGRLELMQIPPMGSLMMETTIEWSRDSRELLLEQPVQGSTQKNLWIGSLPKTVTAY
ncbi:MAG: zf-HC2 domain-containing protein [Bacillota bacterium]